jgi:uncharacterized protein YlzI (FlbEa/FlbD family)
MIKFTAMDDRPIFIAAEAICCIEAAVGEPGTLITLMNGERRVKEAPDQVAKLVDASRPKA